MDQHHVTNEPADDRSEQDSKLMRLLEHVERWSTPSPCHDALAMQAWMTLMSAR